MPYIIITHEILENRIVVTSGSNVDVPKDFDNIADALNALAETGYRIVSTTSYAYGFHKQEYGTDQLAEVVVFTMFAE
jgi:hypothetical protein